MPNGRWLSAAAGGAHGGGSRLTDEGEHAVRLYRLLETGLRGVAGRLQEQMHDLDRLNGLLRAIALRTSARNQWRGTVRGVRRGAVGAEVTLELGDGLAIVATVTRRPSRSCGWHAAARRWRSSSRAGSCSHPSPRRVPAHATACAARSARSGRGAVSTEVRLELAGGRTLTALITRDSVRALHLAVGGRCCALIKASHVLIAVND